MKKLISFEDFKSNMKIKEGVEEIISEGPINDEIVEDTVNTEDIKNQIDEQDDGVIELIVDELRDILTEMEQQGFIEPETTDELDDEYEDWKDWIKAVIELPNFPEEGLNIVSSILNGSPTNNNEFSDYEDENEDENDEENVSNNDLTFEDEDDD